VCPADAGVSDTKERTDELGGASELRQNVIAGLEPAGPAPSRGARSRRAAATDWRRSDRGSPLALDGPVVTLALVGGRRLLRDATASLLTAQDGLHVLGTFESAAHFLAVGVENAPELILLDCDQDAPEVWPSAVASLVSPHVGSRVAMLCRELSEELVRCAIEHRVSGVLLKSYSTREVAAAISYMATGRTVMPAGWQRAVSPAAPAPLPLSPRHRQILALIAEGYCTEAIATELQLSPNTIKFHIRALYSRLGVRNRVEAANHHAHMTNGGP
jgi:DNA-binding NarL/FixJ family response regulator